MSHWEPLDERVLLQENSIAPGAYLDNSSPQEHQAPQNAFADASESGQSSLDGRHGAAGGGREISREMILRSIERQGTKKRPHVHSEDPHAEDKFLAAQSHLRLNGLHVGRIANLAPLKTLEVLYLYDNQITVMENLSVLRRLTHLYLANNSISAIQGLAGMKFLQKLYLEGNCVQVVSGLEAVPSLEELHLSNQRLPPGAGLTFDPASVAALAPSLRILAVSSCGLTSDTLAPVAGLPRLRRLDAAHNGVDSVEALEGVVGRMAVLGNLDLRGNPVCKQPKYRDNVILMNDAVQTLDDEPVTTQQREFLLRLHIRRMKNALAAEMKGGGEEPQQSQHGGAGGAGQGPSHGHAPGLGGGLEGQGQAHGQGQDPRGPQGMHLPHSASGISGSSRLPPRTGGFNQPHASATVPGGAGGASGAQRGLSRNASGGSRGGSGRGGVAAVTLGMDGMSLSSR
ncbi:hypothetical protein HYH03_010731 [Edaphochlamys debaryana]|uniref:Uncharacterized protein n=1 Tax=Edaphochlamys debaryana TaxID=47281 RepID=A0A836BX51_9CHLO|nr:hypothetical protein HYH03_010731 [Edaphochlamys debaryana]|eukprot:KAG2490809.1 hypothetical protein HYH03_010731 [Edaphochlamys debaryana]